MLRSCDQTAWAVSRRQLNEHKVTAAARLIEESGLDLVVETHRIVLQDYLDAHPDERTQTDLVISAVDTYQARREIAGWLPKAILNAGTSATDFTVSRHRFGDGYACLACLYPARPEEAQLDAVTARELAPAFNEARRVSHENSSNRWLTRVASLARRTSLMKMNPSTASTTRSSARRSRSRRREDRP
jgi:hypothetical protein